MQILCFRLLNLSLKINQERRKCKWQSLIRNKHQKELHQKQAKFLAMDVTVRNQNQLLAVL